MSVKEVLKNRFKNIASNESCVDKKYLEIRSRLLDLIEEAESLNIL